MSETTVDVADLIRERDALTARIDAAFRTRAEAYTDELDVLQRWATHVGSESGLEVTEGDRKNVRTLTLGGWLSIRFGYPAENYSTGLEIVTAGGIRAEFPNELPPLAAFTGYLRGLIEFDRDEAGENDR